jgi:hypothetical protein
MRKHAEEFQRFIMDTFNELYKIETKQLLAKSSIRIFIGFDISIIVDGHNQQWMSAIQQGDWASTWDDVKM